MLVRESLLLEQLNLVILLETKWESCCRKLVISLWGNRLVGGVGRSGVCGSITCIFF